MAKEKQTRRMIAMALAAAVTMSSVPVVAFAEDGGAVDSVTTTTGPDTTDNGDGTSTTVSAETISTGDATTSNDGQPGHPVANGSTETTTTTTLTDSEGNVLSVEVEKVGESVNTTGNPITGSEDADDKMSVEVPMKPGEEKSASDIKKEITEETTTTDNEDGTTTVTTTTTTTVKEEIVTVTTSEVKTEEVEISDTGMQGIGPEEYDGKERIETVGPEGTPYGTPDEVVLKHFHEYTYTNDNGESEKRYYPIVGRTAEEFKLLPDDIQKLYKVPEAEGGLYMPVNDENMLDAEHSWDFIYAERAELGMSGNAHFVYEDGKDVAKDTTMFALYDKNGNVVYTYCMDVDTSTERGKLYTVENLEEANYFVGKTATDLNNDGVISDDEKAIAIENEKAHVRAAVEKGYWGAETGTGSLESLKENLKAALQDGMEVDFTFMGRDGGKNNVKEINYNTRDNLQALLDMVDQITEGEALNATQAAIWVYGNQSEDLDYTYLGVKRSHTYQDGTKVEFEKTEGMTDQDNCDVEARMELIKAFLNSEYLKEKVAKENNGTTIIDNDSFLVEDSLSLEIGEKAQLAEDDVRNTDDNSENDVYNANFTFKMVVTPGEKDDLVVTLVDGNGNEIRKARIAGDDSKDDTTFTGVKSNGNGSYTFENLQLQEGQNTTFNLNLDGVQYLEEGVYIYKATEGYDSVQTMVGMSKGEKEVDVTTTVNFSFKVDEKEQKVVSKAWRTVKATPPSSGGDNPPGDGGNTPPSPITDIPEEDPPLTNIPDEKPPLSNVPGEDEGIVLGAEEEKPMVLGAEEEAPLIAATGDSNHMAAGFGGMLAALAGMFMLRKKKEN